MRIRRLIILGGVLVFLASLPVTSRAQMLSPQEVYAKRAPSVVFFRSKARGVDIGYGVLISKQGHVLTAKHVVDAFGGEPINATLGSKMGAALEFEPGAVHQPQLDVSLLKIANLPAGLQPAPIGKADHFKTGQTRVEILTGFADEPNSIPLSALISNQFRSDLWNAQGPIDRGNSGSPAYDEFGNVVGFVPSGYAGTGLFLLQTLDSIADWLDQNGVHIEPRIKPDKFIIFVRGPRQVELRASLQQRLTEIADRWLGIRHADVEQEPQLIAFLEGLRDFPSEVLLKQGVNLNIAKQWFADRDVRKLYIYVVDLSYLPSEDLPDLAQQFLVTLESEGNGDVSPVMLKLNSARLQPIPKDGDSDRQEKLLTSNAFALLKAAASTLGTRFRKNDYILAQCLSLDANLPADAANRLSEWQYDAAQRLRDELEKTWQLHPVYHSYRVEGALPSRCSNVMIGNPENEQSTMAEVMIMSVVKGYEAANGLSVQWSLRKLRSNSERSGKKVSVHLAGDDFASGLASNIVSDWDKMLPMLGD